jgi:ATP-dependent Clp protease ATP-binding subunit ClpC
MERFTKRTRRALSLAQAYAESLGHTSIGPEHLLIGLLRTNGGMAKRVLHDLHLDERRVEDLIKQLTRAREQAGDALVDLSPGMKKVLEFAVDEARCLGHHYVGTEHLLLGLVRQNEGIAIEVLKRLNVTPEDVRRHIRRMLRASPIQPNADSPLLLYKMLRLAEDEAKLQGSGNIGTEHVLLGLMQLPENGIVELSEHVRKGQRRAKRRVIIKDMVA